MHFDQMRATASTEFARNQLGESQNKFACVEKKNTNDGERESTLIRTQKKEKREESDKKATITKCGIHSIPSGRLVW